MYTQGEPALTPPDTYYEKFPNAHEYLALEAINKEIKNMPFINAIKSLNKSGGDYFVNDCGYEARELMIHKLSEEEYKTAYKCYAIIYASSDLHRYVVLHDFMDQLIQADFAGVEA